MVNSSKYEKNKIKKQIKYVFVCKKCTKNHVYKWLSIVKMEKRFGELKRS